MGLVTAGVVSASTLTAIAGTAATAIGTGVSIYGAEQSASAQRQAQNYQA